MYCKSVGGINWGCNVMKLSSSSEIWMVSGELLCDLSELNGEKVGITWEA